LNEEEVELSRIANANTGLTAKPSDRLFQKLAAAIPSLPRCFIIAKNDVSYNETIIYLE